MKYFLSARPWYIILAFLFSLSAAVHAGTFTGLVLEENGEVMDNIVVLAYTGEDPERYTALPDELSRAFQTRTDREGKFSLTIPDTIKTFTFKVKIDTAIYNPIIMKDLENRSGTYSLGEPFVACTINSENFWISSDANAKVPNTLSTDTNRWEQIKVRGKLLPIYFRETRIEPLTVEPVEGSEPELKGLPQRKK